MSPTNRIGLAAEGKTSAAAETPCLLALDLGSSTGRLYLGKLATSGVLHMEEVDRFANGPVQVAGHVYWDFLHLWQNVGTALAKVAVRLDGPATLGIDSFGVDYVLTDAGGHAVAGMRHMRDKRTGGLYDAVYARIPKPALYRRTGSMEIEINTLLQLVADQRDQPWLFAIAEALHLAPDYVTHLLTGQRVSEISIASTTQLIDPTRRDWDLDLAGTFGIPRHWLAPVVEPGQVIGPIQPSEAARLQLRHRIDVVAVASHDTASAAAVVPYAHGAARERSAFISLGTWSLVGQELRAPDLGDASCAANFTNECGVAGSIVHHKIQAGLWLMHQTLQEAQRTQPALGFAALAQLAANTTPLQYVFDADDPAFRDPVSMPEAIRQWFAQRALPAPTSLGELARSIYDSLALSYRTTVEQMQGFRGVQIETLHIVGGGASIELLCQAVADATGVHVIAGPVEATVAGNMVAQLVARGVVSDFEQGRDLVSRSFPVTHYHPSGDPAWAHSHAQLHARTPRPSNAPAFSDPNSN